MSTRSDSQSVLTDDRGAIMVMGIFMCSCLVAALWYLAGIGDAIIYRERLQEAADAVAFSDAALHARGMNLIVLINLVMAVILGIRVALRFGKMILTVAASALTVTSAIPGGEWAIPLAAGATAGAVAVTNADNATKAPIDAALHALVAGEKAISAATPILARTAATKTVGDSYQPVVTEVGIHEPNLLGLPLEAGDPGKLCNEAVSVLTQIHEATLEALPDPTHVISPIGKGIAFIVDPAIKAIGSSDSDYFCDLQAGASQSSGDGSFTEKVNKQAYAKTIEKRCTDPAAVGDAHDQFVKAELDWETACFAFGITSCNGFDPGLDKVFGDRRPKLSAVRKGSPSGRPERDVLDDAQLKRDLAARTLVSLEEHGFGSKDCAQVALQDLTNRAAAQHELAKAQGKEKDPSLDLSSDNGTSKGSSDGDIAPMRVKDFENGNDKGQVLAGARGDVSRLQPSARIVRIATFHDKRTPALADPQSAAVPAIAQAEMFYDCGDNWKTCNADEEAMWHFKWRPRLRRLNQSTSSALASLTTLGGGLLPAPRTSQDAFATALAREALSAQAGTTPNAALRHDLANSINDQTTHAQGVH